MLLAAKKEKTIVTTSQPREHLINIATSISQELNIDYIPRGDLSIRKFKEIHNIDYLFIVREDRVQVINHENEEFFFHPGLSIPRVKVLRKDEMDSMVNAMGLQNGDKVLDCTLGLANDAIVASFVVGEKGQVVGLESSPYIYTITKWGLKNYQRGSKFTKVAMERIEVIWTNYEDFLDTQREDAFDIVYFDPMFKNPLLKSSGINNLRYFANYQEINNEIIMKAQKVARKRVVIKNRVDSGLFKKLGIDNIIGGKYSSIAFGVLNG